MALHIFYFSVNMPLYIIYTYSMEKGKYMMA